jgi:hypothetical protein
MTTPEAKIIEIVSGSGESSLRFEQDSATRRRWDALAHYKMGDFAPLGGCCLSMGFGVGMSEYTMFAPAAAAPDEEILRSFSWYVEFDGEDDEGVCVGRLERVVRQAATDGAPDPLTDPHFAPVKTLIESVIGAGVVPAYEALSPGMPWVSTDRLDTYLGAGGRGHAFGHYLVNAWYAAESVDLNAAIAATAAGDSPFEDEDMVWRHAQRGGTHLFTVPLANFAWVFRFPHRVHVRHSGPIAERIWMSIPVDADGVVHEPQLQSSRWRGELEDGGAYGDRISPIASHAFWNFLERFRPD